ncbi:AAA family ATPase [Nostoc spongiaeforme FACHB-130]|uniref:histidine kinase n=1 Tax=Nostoc spongiaeforme FACHB-130 TaxID=1357510 RepID=A0ABR8G4D1_9NOSO|nr:ATP-binding sensor histidine kinase [Nostoc spongiaeforme]MBD2598129.1 AAA family ATPase [Nostoc spongiaeforme FACHB-130]
MADSNSTRTQTLLQLSGYQILEQIYRGTRTIVYRAVQTETKRPVVIKVLHQDYPSFSELVQFRNQYTITKNLPIAGIVQPLSLESLGNSYALVMEDLGSISLGQYLQQQPLSLAEMLTLAIQLAEILHHLHQHRVIHKDIKPANILIHPDSKQVQLIDFSIASLLPKETQTIQNPNVLEGTLAYLAPEQTGRMNRGIDYRTDFYALGITLYQLLTRQLPFISEDPLELIHCHIAQVPMSVNQVNPDVPPMVAAIVAKLMAKNAEDRYQSALGLKYDLEHCLSQYKETGTIAEFKLGQRDLCDRFTIPEKLYGRETEVQVLLDAFERVAVGTTELMLVAGFSGIGKTAVINEVHKPIVRQRGYFIKGKFDQFNRNIPFSAFVQAFRDLVGQLLSESDTQLQHWKTQTLAALGENAQVIIELIPELERIIGIQPPAVELSGTAAQNRFNLLFQRFIQVFTIPEHPLVMFVDDLQWADLASLNLIQVLMSESQTGCLLLLGAYRDNEVFATHPLMLTLNGMEKAGVKIHTITLQPLTFTSLNHLIADTLHAPASIVQPLTELVIQKTQGNPFFANQFLKALHQDQLITFNSNAGYWQCNILQVREAALTNDVVELMVQQLQKLPQATQEILKLAACIGAQFDLNTLAIVSQQSPTEVAATLWKALQEGLILPQGDLYKFYLSETQATQHTPQKTLNYRFLHDRVQQAAYSLIPEKQKQTTHLKIGQLLLHKSANSEREERLFEIVNHLNIGRGFISQPQEREDLAQLNLEAGRKAKTSTAYEAAIAYLSTGIELLPKTAWESHYSLSLALYEEMAEASYLNTDFEQMEQWANLVLQRAKNLLDTIKVQQTRIMGAKAQGKLLDSLNIGLQVLKELGIEFPQQPTQADIREGYEGTRSHWIDKPPQSLLDLPTMSDSHLLAAMNMLTILTPAAYVTSPNLMLLLIFKQVELSIKSGNAPVSIFTYGDYGIVLCGIMGDITNGYDFGELALSLLERFQAKSFTGRSGYVVNTYIKHWKIGLSEIVPCLQAAYRNSLETGDIEALGCNAVAYCAYAYHQGQNLTEIVKTMEAYRQTIIQYKLAFSLPFQEIYQQTALNLLGETATPYILTGTIFNQEQSLPQLQATNQRTALFYWFFNQSILYYIFAKNYEAIQTSAETAQYLDGVVGMFIVPLYFWFDALIQLAQYTESTPVEERQFILLKVQQHQEKLQYWATLSPVNHQHRWQLIEAERYRVIGKRADAVDAYDRAIAGAKANGFIQDEALANELAAKFYLNWEKEKVAAGYMQEAYYCYSRWGAKAKVADLETNYPDLLRPILQQAEVSTSILSTLATISPLTVSPHPSDRKSSSITNINNSLDFAIILKASQALSSTIHLDELLHQLTQIILQNSGADRCALMLLSETGEWQVRAIATLNETQLCAEPLINNPHIPVKLIQYVKNTQEFVVIDNLETTLPVIGDYLRQHQPKSLLCLPLLHQGHLIGILYLNNQLTCGVFTQARILILNFLCTQAAISLENARLYQQSQNYAQQLERSQLQVVQSEKMASLGNLVAGVAHEINNPIGFLNGSINNARDYVQDLLDYIALYQEHHPQAATTVKQKAKEIDLEFLTEDLPKLLNSMKGATDRITSISNSLRTFSRADTEYKVSANLHEGLDSTLLILKYRLKANEFRPEIQIIQEFGDLPPIECFPGQLNQVFMNILANAIDMFDEMAQTQSFKELEANPQIITIRTEVISNQVDIRIRDNGKGMTQEVQKKIFDHLFTTKAVGKGTGLGLSIARQIVVEKHGGRLEVQSQVGQGSEFCIYLPIGEQ